MPACSRAADKPPDVPGWRLVWHDEFGGRELDHTKWRPEDAALEKNNEKQYYTPEDVYLENGSLVLRSQDRPRGKRAYTSGLVETVGLFSQRYGRFEVRAKLPRGRGIWPAHWLLPDDNSWPPEIDIMELLGHDPKRIYMTNHWRAPEGPRHEGRSFEGPDFTADFHTFTMEWDPDEIRWYVDGVQRHSTRKNVPDVAMRIILNTAVGGNWPKDPDKTTLFPQYHFIDYVRVYVRDNIEFVDPPSGGVA